jgi:hypothetical protein
MPGTRVKGKQWYPIKYDMVAKQAVMDTNADNRKTLKTTLYQEFGKENVVKGHDCTAIKAH